MLTDACDADYLFELQKQIRSSRYFAVNNLNRDFVGTRGFSVVFRRSAQGRVIEQFPWLERYMKLALRDDCNAFYLNPLQLTEGSHVAPHIDRSLHAYVADVLPPLEVSVLYIEVPKGLRGGGLVLRRGKKFLGRVFHVRNLLLRPQVRNLPPSALVVFHLPSASRPACSGNKTLEHVQAYQKVFGARP